MKRYDIVEWERDDLTYRMRYGYSPRVPATRWQPAEGGVEVDRVDVVLRGGVVLPVTEYERLADLPDLIERAEAQEREREEA